MTGPSAKPPKPGIAEQARVLSAFVQAFGKTLMTGKPHHKGVAAQLQATPPGTSRLWAKNAKLVLEDGITLLLDRLQAEVRVNDPQSPLIPEHPESFSFNIQVGRMAMDEQAISHLLNRYAFPAGARSPIYNLRVSLPDGLIVLEGTLRVNRFLTIGVLITSTVAVTADGLIELTPIEIKGGSLPVHKLMGMLGVDLDRVVPGSRDANPALRFLGDRILISPTAMFPAPRASGELVHAEVTGSHLVMSYDDGSLGIEPPLIEREAGAYLAMLGHDLLVGKLTMTDVCLQIVPIDTEATWVEFSLPHYRAQLAQGESHLGYADELLYRVPAIAELKTAPLPPGRPASPRSPGRA